MRVVIDRNTFVRGQLAQAGETVEIPDGDARSLIAMGKAHLAPGEPGEPAPAEKPEPPLPEKVPDLKTLPYPLRVKVGRRSKKHA